MDTPAISITCGHCGCTHHDVGIVRACHDGATISPCDDLVLDVDEDGPRAVPCEAEAAFTKTGFWCTNGHEHTDAENRLMQGWDYAEDAYDAGVIMAGARTPRPMGPNTTWDHHEANRVAFNVIRGQRP